MDRPLPAAALDVAAVAVFVLIGRSSHTEAASLAGTAVTAWPFLAALALGWVVARAWRAPSAVARPRPTGLVVWASTVVVGQVLRVAAGQGSAVSFVVVTAVALAVLLLGWRAALHLVQRRRRPTGRPTGTAYRY